MIRNARLFILLTVMALSAQFVLAQGIDFSKPELLTVEKLMPYAIKNAPKLRFQNAVVAAEMQELVIQKLNWTEHITFNAGGFAGGANIASFNTTSNAEYLMNSSRNDVNYSVSIVARIPLSDIIRRPQESKLQRLRIEKAEAERSLFEQELRIVVSQALDNLLSASANLLTRTANYEANKLAYEVGEQSFLKGALPTTEYTQILARKIMAQEELQKAQAACAFHLHYLQILVGAPIAN